MMRHHGVGAAFAGALENHQPAGDLHLNVILRVALRELRNEPGHDPGLRRGIGDE